MSVKKLGLPAMKKNNIERKFAKVVGIYYFNLE